MKNLILAISLLFAFNSFAQEASYHSIDLKLPTSNYDSRSDNIPVVVGMLLGGTTFILAGILTPSIYEGGSTTEKKPFYMQPKFLPILSGALIIGVAIPISFSK